MSKNITLATATEALGSPASLVDATHLISASNFLCFM